MFCFICSSFQTRTGVSIGSACNRRHRRFHTCIPTLLSLRVTARVLRESNPTHPSRGSLHCLGRSNNPNPNGLRPFKLLQIRTSAGTFSPRLGFLTSVMESPDIGVAILAQPSNRVAPPLEGSRRGLVRRMASTRSLRISYADSRRKRLKLLPITKREADDRSVGALGRSV